MPTKKADFIRVFNKTKNRSSPNVSPCSSDVEDEDDVDSLDSDASAPENNDLEFGSDSEEEGGEGKDEEDSAYEEEDSGREEEDNESESEDD